MDNIEKIKSEFLRSFSVWETVIIQLDNWSNYRTKLLSEPYELWDSVVALFEWLGAYDIERCFIDDWD